MTSPIVFAYAVFVFGVLAVYMKYWSFFVGRKRFGGLIKKNKRRHTVKRLCERQ